MTWRWLTWPPWRPKQIEIAREDRERDDALDALREHTQRLRWTLDRAEKEIKEAGSNGI